MRNPLLVALDVVGAEPALRLVEELTPVVAGFKVGKELFVREGPALVRQLRAAGARVFLDLKFHDIPNTVARAVTAAVELDVQMITVHASGGPGMLEAAETAAQDTAARLGIDAPLVLAVTVLTSMTQPDLAAVGVSLPLGRQVENLARLALAAGLRGLVCSPLEIPFLRALVPPQCQLVTPGIRPAGAAPDDQRRTLTAAEALAAGADWLVVGRPIYAAPSPRAAAEAMLNSCSPAE